MNRTLRVLHVEDSEQDAALLTRYLTRAGYTLTSERVQTAAAMKAALESREWDVVLCDYSMPRFNAVTALAVLKETALDLPFIIISGTVGESVAVEAMRAGAHDYLMKDNLVRLGPTIERELHEAENRRARRQAETKLRKTEAQYGRLLDTSYEGVWVFDAELRITYVNERLAEMLRVRPEEMIGHSVTDFLDAEARADVEQRWRRRAQGVKEQYDLRLQRRDGTNLWAIVCATPILGEQGEFVGALSMLTDITERQQAEKALRESEARKRAILESALDCIITMDHAGLVVDWNPAAERTFGYSREEAIGKEMAELIIPSNLREHHRRGLAHFLAVSEGPVLGKRLELKAMRADGSEFPIELAITSIESEGSAMFSGYIRNITERKRAEHELKESEERYRDLVENAHDIIYSHDLDGNYTSVNRAGELITGYSHDECLALNIAKTIAPEHVSKAREMLAKKLAGEKVTAYEVDVLAKDGKRVAVEVNTKLILQDGVPVGVQGIARDVTERRQLEEQLRQSQKLEAIGQLAGGIAHDFNNLLTAINGYSSLALQRIEGNPTVKTYLEEIKKAGDRAANLTRQLLAFGRKQILQPVPLSLNDVITDMSKMLRRLIGEDIQFGARLTPDLKRIKADPGQIEQVLVNLVVNARDAMPQGGNLTIETANAELDREYASTHVGVRAGAYIVLAVSDTGTGMDEQVRKQIFEPFFTTKEKGKGTGLGLSTVYGIVKQSGGNIWVYSERNHGTTFKVYLPAFESVPRSSEGVAAESVIPKGSETVLLVEDEEVVRGLACQILEEAGYQVLVAPQGEEAIRLCIEHPTEIHLLLTDVVMPGAGGKEVADRLNSLRPGIKVLFMSGYTDEAIVHHGVLDSNVKFIQKPFSPAALAKKVREVLDSNGQGPIK